MKLSARTANGIAIACVTVAALTLTGCGGSGHKKSTSSAPPPTTSSSTPTPTPAKPVVQPVNPLTGLRPSSNRVVAVKIDDTANGRPQVGTNYADIVYIEEVEGGLTRLLAVFNTHLPTVEAVRSTRAGDPEILAEYGPIAYVASGGSHNPLQVLDRSNLKASINDRGGPGFARDGGRPAPYNLRANLNTIANAMKGARERNVGLTWSKSIANAPVGKGTTVQTRVGGTPVQFNWDAKLNRYVRLIDGNVQHTANGALIDTPNVIVQFCNVTVYTKDRDVLGNPNKYTHTVGRGKAVVFRNGHRIVGTWYRPTLASGTKFLDSHGKQIPLSPGGAWVVLTSTNAPLA